MASTIKVDTIQDQDGNNIINENADVITVGASGDTITIPAGATFDSSAATNTLPATVVTTDGTQTLTNKSIATTQLTGTITPSDSTVSLAKLTATGTQDSTTFLRGDNTFASAGGANTPTFLLKQTSVTTIPNSTRTKVNIDSAVIDTASGLDATNKRWVVPAGQAGTYLICYSGRLETPTDIDEVSFTIRKNNTVQFSVWGRNEAYHTFTQSFLIALSVGDYLEMFAKQSSGSSQTVTTADQGLQTFFSGFKLIA